MTKWFQSKANFQQKIQITVRQRQLNDQLIIDIIYKFGFKTVSCLLIMMTHQIVQKIIPRLVG